MKAVILAAGVGRRLGLSYSKALLRFGGKTMLERTIYSLYIEGLKDIVILTGYGEDGLRLLGSNLSRILSGLEITYVFNKRYDETNNIYSLWLARGLFSDEGFILLNCDVLYHTDILRLLLRSSHESAIAIDDYKKLGREQMKVKVNNCGAIERISKEIDAEEADGEYIGMAKFGAGSTSLLSEALDEVISQGSFDLFYEGAIQMICGKTSIFGLSTQRLPWIEIDSPEDVKKAVLEIYPSLALSS